MRKGFTLIEIVVSVTLMAILVGTYFMVANPAGQLAASRNSRRQLDLQLIGNSIRANYADQGNESFACAAGPLPTSTKRMTSASGSANYNIAPCLIPTTGIFAMPSDPSASSSHFNSVSDYDTGYSVSINASGTVITLTAPYAELGKTISVMR